MTSYAARRERKNMRAYEPYLLCTVRVVLAHDASPSSADRLLAENFPRPIALDTFGKAQFGRMPLCKGSQQRNARQIGIYLSSLQTILYSSSNLSQATPMKRCYNNMQILPCATVTPYTSLLGPSHLNSSSPLCSTSLILSLMICTFSAEYPFHGNDHNLQLAPR